MHLRIKIPKQSTDKIIFQILHTALEYTFFLDYNEGKGA